VPDDCARTFISLEANALLSHEVINTSPPWGYFRISTVMWLYPTEPIQRDYTPLHTVEMSVAGRGCRLLGRGFLPP
jgi:hypothetical protein